MRMCVRARACGRCWRALHCVPPSRVTLARPTPAVSDSHRRLRKGAPAPCVTTRDVRMRVHPRRARSHRSSSGIPGARMTGAARCHEHPDAVCPSASAPPSTRRCLLLSEQRARTAEVALQVREAGGQGAPCVRVRFRACARLPCATTWVCRTHTHTHTHTHART